MFTNKHYVLTIYREGSFSRAAEKLYISQPSLSASVKRIEEKTGAPIFNRATNPISLTEIGKEYVKYAVEIEEKEKDFERYLYDCTNLLTGTVRIGGSSLFSSFMLPEMISKFNKEYPQIKFEVFEDSTKNLIEKLSYGYLDIIIDNAVIENPIISSTVYTTENLLIAVPALYEINNKLKDYRFTASEIKKGKHRNKDKSVSLYEFSEYPFILLNPENDTGRRANILFKKYGIYPKTIFLLDQQVTSYNISASGMGISFISDTLIRHLESEQRLYFYTINDNETIRNIYFCKKNNHYLSLSCKKFIEFLSDKQ